MKDDELLSYVVSAAAIVIVVASAITFAKQKCPLPYWTQHKHYDDVIAPFPASGLSHKQRISTVIG